jgi:hypothetical protein
VKRQILVFASRDSVHARAARELAEAVGGRYVDRLANNLTDLTLVARFKVVEPVAIVVLMDDQVVLRVPRLVSREALERDLHEII